MPRYFIGLGANIGDPALTLRAAVDQLAKIGTRLERSRVYACNPIGGPPQPTFLNAAVAFDSDLEPHVLLTLLQGIENRYGRNRKAEVKWGPRTLDLDILLMGQVGEQSLDSPELVVPHPRLHERAFALAPLVELDGRLMHPKLGRPLRSLLAAAVTSGQLTVATGQVL